MSFRDQMMGEGRSALETLDRLSGRDTSTLINLKKIRLDGGTQPRAELDIDLIREYAAAMLNGDEFPPVTVFYDGTDYWLADGFHRVNAAHLANMTAIKAEVRQGTQRDAVLYSVGVNAEHGKRRTNADKRRAVMTLLADAEWAAWSDNEIAAKCKVSQPFVSKIRRELSYNGYKMDTAEEELSGNGYQMDAAEEGLSAPSAENPQIDDAAWPPAPYTGPYAYILNCVYPYDVKDAVMQRFKEREDQAVEALPEIIERERTGRNRRNIIAMLESLLAHFEQAVKAAVEVNTVAKAQENVQRQQEQGTRKVQRGGTTYEQQTSREARRKAGPGPSVIDLGFKAHDAVKRIASLGDDQLRQMPPQQRERLRELLKRLLERLERL